MIKMIPQTILMCILYDHVHLMVRPNGEIANISKLMQYLKRHFSRNANIVMGYQDIPENEGDICKCRLPGEYELSGKMNQYVKKLRIKFNKFPKTQKIQIPPFRWQKSFYDHIIRGEKDFDIHYEYTIGNYEKHNGQEETRYNYSEDFRFTSLNFPEMIDNVCF